MYIKRNVYFSAVDQETGEERLFSTTEIMTEEAYVEKMYSLDPVTGETITKEEYKKRIQELGGTKKAKGGKMAMKAGTKKNIAAQQAENQAKAKAQIMEKQALRKVTNSNAGRYIASKAFEAGKKAGAKGKVGYGKAGLIAGGAALASGALGFGGSKMAANKRED